MENLSAAEGF